VSPARPGPEDWRRINDVFHRALEEPADGREAFIREACAGRPDLQAEVATLLAAHDRSGQFIEPAGGVAAAALDAPVPVDGGLAGQTIGHYRIRGVIGEGGMGVVYLADDVRLGRSVALKAVSPRFTGDPARRDRLEREARAAAALTHPGIATVYALEEFDGQVFIAGEYVPGETLREELGRGPVAPARAVDTAVGIARALAAAHDRGVVHRDLKPENLIRTPAGDVKILDFGLARIRDVPPALARLTDDGTFLGTPAYMSPEQIRGEAIDGRSDLFSLGIVLFELLSGVHPFAGRDPASTIARILEAEPPRLSQAAAAGASDLHLLGELESIVRTCLRKSPEARYPSAHELAAALARARDHLADPRPIELTPPAAPSSSASWWWQFHQGAVCVAYPLLLVALWIARGQLAGRTGRLLFLTGLTAAIAAVVLRLHLWFVHRVHPDDWTRQHDDAARWVRIADGVFVAALVAGGLGALDASGELAAVLVGSAAGVFISAFVIEPATARAAMKAAARSRREEI
jgi:serine/threonine protein kinase